MTEGVREWRVWLVCACAWGMDSRLRGNDVDPAGMAWVGAGMACVACVCVRVGDGFPPTRE